MPIAIEIDAAGRPPLGMAPEQFLRDYWQKRPILLRRAFPNFVSPISGNDLAGLACEPRALSRLVLHARRGDRYRVEHGPFPERRFAALPERDWTVLVQDVDKWDAEVAALLPRFAFLPRWRLDDVMVSFAAPGGSVGAHVDEYDVFLVQAEGVRRWEIDAGPSPDLSFRDDGELRLLRHFQPDHAWRLEPGDMLYLPPGVPHHGIAESACLTLSIGMRAPARSELLLDLAETLASELPEQFRYRDPDLTPSHDPHEIDPAALARVRAAVPMFSGLDPDRLRDWFGAFITRYRTAGEFEPPRRPPTPTRIEAVLNDGGRLRRDRFARLAWAGAGRAARLYAHGQSHAMGRASARRLAAAETLDARAFASLDRAGREAAIALTRCGILRLEPARPVRRTKR